MPATPTKRRSKPPSDVCPADYVASVDKMELTVRLILADFRVPWLIQHILSEADMVTTADLVQAYTPALLESNFDSDFGFHKVYNYTTISGRRAIGRLQSALKESDKAQEERSKRRQTDINATNETSNAERHHLEGVWTLKTQLPAPPLRDQGSSKFMMKLYKSIQQNDIGDFSNNQIISENPDSGDKTCKKRRREHYVDGHSKDAEEESRQDPYDYESWERQVTIWRNTLLMCIWANPQDIRLQITKADLDGFYDNLLGDDIYKKKPQPSLRTMMISERKAWGKIRELLHKGLTLAASLTKMLNDTLFWQREVYEFIKQPGTLPKGPGKGSPKGYRGKGKPYGKPYGTPYYDSVVDPTSAPSPNTDGSAQTGTQPALVPTDRESARSLTPGKSAQGRTVLRYKNLTWTKLQNFLSTTAPPTKDGSPGKPLRGRGMDEIWGLPSNTATEQAKFDNDSILLLRMLHLANVARHHKKSILLFLLEHPADPALHSSHPEAHTCATIWGTTTLLAFGHERRLFGTTFAQCMLGNLVDKMTKLLHNIPLLRQLDNLQCDRNSHAKITDTKQLARWGWQLNIMIAQGVSAHLKYLRNYDRTQILTDRPHDSTIGSLPNQKEVIVQIGHKQRPFRDGGGKPSPGQPFALPLMSSFAFAAGDADWEFQLLAAKALPLGVTEVLLRTPGIWPTTFEMNEYNEDCEQPEPPHDAPNCPSELNTKIASRPRRYLEKLRTIHDATVNDVNLWLRRHQPERTAAPGLFDLLYEIYYLHHMDTTKYTVLKTDVVKAHRRMLIKPQDWKFMVAMIKSKYWINTVGTYGVASAQYHLGANGNFDPQEIESLVFRLLWTTYICPTLRPFLQPLYSWMKVIQSSGRPSDLLRLLATTMLYLIEQTATTINPTPDCHVLHGATDAGANDHEGTQLLVRPADPQGFHWLQRQTTLSKRSAAMAAKVWRLVAPKGLSQEAVLLGECNDTAREVINSCRGATLKSYFVFSKENRRLHLRLFEPPESNRQSVQRCAVVYCPSEVSGGSCAMESASLTRKLLPLGIAVLAIDVSPTATSLCTLDDVAYA
ncbi:unnamed protein product, partial [Polarella glacialis]